MKKRRLMRQLIAMVMATLMFSSLFTTVALEIKALSDNENKWQDVLDTDLSDYQGEPSHIVADEYLAAESEVSLIDPATNTPTDTAIADKAVIVDTAIADKAVIVDTAALAEAMETYEGDRFIIKYKDTASSSSIAASQQAVDKIDFVSEVKQFSASKSLVLETDELITAKEVLTSLSDTLVAQIEYIQPDYEMTFYAKELQPIEGGIRLPITPVIGGGMTVALLDTGVDTSHASFANALVDGFDFVNDDGSVNDADSYYDQGHGTSMAGIIAASGALVMPLKVFEGGKAYTSDIIEAIAYADANSASIANMSFGGRFYNPALEEAIAGSSMLFVCAAGNMLVNTDKYPFYPAALDLPNVISVGSVSAQDKLSRFSNYGVNSVDVTAMGEEVMSVFLDGQMVASSGTSASAAGVSGLAAKIMAQKGIADAASLKTWIIESSDTITGLQDKISGGKRINESYALSNAAIANHAVIDVPDDEPLPDIDLDGEIEEDDYEEFGADGLVTQRTPMPTAREGLGVVAVGKKIYAIGGQNGTTYYNKVEIYDTETDTWTTGTGMTYAVSYFSCVANGTDIYCFGGYNGSYLNYVQVYNTLTNTWSTKTGMTYGLMGTAAVLYNGKIYVTGGYNGTFRAYVYEYNIAANTWTKRSNLLYSRGYHSAAVYNGIMYLEGGASSTTGAYLNNEEYYNLSTYVSNTNGVSRASGMNAPLIADGSRTISIGGSQYLTSGYSNVITYSDFTIANGTYTKKTTMSMRRASAGAAMVDGSIYIIGGKNEFGVTNLVERIEGGYNKLTDMPAQLTDFQAAELNNKLYVIGGYTNAAKTVQSLRTYEYDLFTSTWKIKTTNTPSFFTGCPAVSAFGKIYLLTSSDMWEYDPKADSWTKRASAPAAVKYAAEFNGKIYAMNTSAGKLYIYDPLANTWTTGVTLPWTAAVTMYNISFIGDQLYCFTSSASTGYCVYSYDIGLQTWGNSTVSSIPGFVSPIYSDFFMLPATGTNNTIPVQKYTPGQSDVLSYNSFHSAYTKINRIVTANNKIYAFMGNSALAEAIVEYMPSVSPWVNKASSPYSNASAGLAEIGGKIYLAGGYTTNTSTGTTMAIRNKLLVYDTQTNTWLEKTGMQIAVQNPAAAASGGKLYIISGATSTTGASTSAVQEYNPSTNTWDTKAAYTYSLHSAAAASYNGKIYVFGGIRTSTAYNYVGAYNPSTNTWETCAAMPTARYGAGAVEYGGKIYVVGGFNASGVALTIVEEYNPATNTWATKEPLPVGRGYFGIAVDDGIYVIGGSDGYSQTSTVYQYNLATNKWSGWTNIDMALSGHAAIAANGGIYVFNGQWQDGTYPKSTQFAFTESIADNAELLHLGSDTINLSGNLSRNYSDLNIVAPGFTMEVGRVYNSRDTRISLISQGWSFSFQGKVEVSGNDTVVRMPDGSARTFKVLADGTYKGKDTRSTLVKSGSEHILTTNDRYMYYFNSSGYLYKMKDPNGNIVTITIDTTGKITKVTDPVGRDLTITYGTNSRISTITDTVGRVVSYFYDATNRLIRVRNADGEDMHYTYDTAGYLSSVKNNAGTIIESFTYTTPAGELLPKTNTITNPFGGVETYKYNAVEGSMTMTTGTRVTTTYYDKAMFPIRAIDAEGGVTLTAYNLDNGINRYGEIRTKTDRNGNTTYYERDIRGNITRIVNPDNSTQLFTYDANDRVTSMTDALSRKTYYTYDTNGNLLKTIKPKDGVLVYSESANQTLFLIESNTYYTSAEAQTMCGKLIGGLLKTYTDGAGYKKTYSYDQYGYVSTVTDSLSRTVTTAYNKIGWLKSETTAMGYTTTYYYNKVGKTVKKVTHGGETTRYFYDDRGNLKQQISPNQYYGQADAYTYTAENIVNAATYSANLTNLGDRYTYNLACQVLTHTDALNNKTTYTYGTFGEALDKTMPASLKYIFTYDKLGRQITKGYKSIAGTVKLEDTSYAILVNGQTTVSVKSYFSDTQTATTVTTYDFAGRLLKTQYPDGGQVAYTYLANGLMSSASDAMGNITYYEYGPLNQKLKQWSPTSGSLYGLTAWSYDSAMRVQAESKYVTAIAKAAQPSGAAQTLTYAYNTDSTVSQVTQNGTRTISYLYDADGRRTGETAKVDAARNAVTTHEYNHLGLLMSSSVTEEKANIDGKGESGTLEIPSIFTYDRNGNMLTQTAANGLKTVYTYDALNRATKVELFEGTTLKTTTSQTYDNMGHILTVTDPNGNLTSYVYTALGFLEQTTDAQGGISFAIYDRQGRVTRSIAPNDFVSSAQTTDYTDYTYDPIGRRTITTRVYTPGSGTAVTLVTETNTYDKNGKVLTTKDALDNTQTFTYDKAGNLAASTDALNNAQTYAYDAINRPISKTDPIGTVYQTVYDLFNNVTSQKLGGTTLITNTYDLAGNMLTTKDAYGNTSTFTYGLTGKVRTATNPEGYSIRYWYDVMGNAVRTLDSLGKETATEYDILSRPAAVTERKSGGSQSITVSTIYDSNGNPLTVTDGRGNSTTTVYDSLNRVSTVTNALEQTSSYTYDKSGNQLTETNWLGNTATFEYDKLGRLVKTTDPSGVVVEQREYNDNGTQSKGIDALGNVTQFFYDKNNRLIITEDASGYMTRQTYDALGRVSAKTDGNGNTTSYSYDIYGNLTMVADPEGGVVIYTYDRCNRMLSQYSGHIDDTYSETAQFLQENAYTYEYSSLGKVTKITEPESNEPEPDPIPPEEPQLIVIPVSYSDIFTYRADGALLTATDKNGVVTTYTYDIHGRVLTETVGTDTTTNTYDNAGNLLTQSRNGITTTRTYDALNRCTSKAVTGEAAITFAYDLTDGLSAGQVGESTTVDGRTTLRVLDKNGRLYQVRQDGAAEATYAYYANGSLKTLTMPGNITSNYTYYPNGKLHTLQNKAGGSTIEAYSYAYDAAGNMTAKQDGKGTTAYTYNGRSQLVTVLEPSGRLTEYSYDAKGNRITEEQTGGDYDSFITYTVDNRDRLVKTTEAVGGDILINAYYYDDAGNVISRMPELLLDADSGATPSLGIWQGSDDALQYAIYAYNSRNQMTEADVGNSSTVNTFGVNGYRSSKTEEGVTTTFSYEYDRIIKEVSLDSATGHEMVTYNVYGVNLISRIVGTDKAYYLYNGHGDVTALVNSNGMVIATYYYDAFGNLLEVTGDYDNPYRYAGYYYDERSKLYDLKARFYDPIIARFMQQDTYRGSREDPLSLNMFAYCTNNPLIYYDPTGHWQESDSKYDYATQQELQRLTEAWYSAGTQAEKNAIHDQAEYIRGIVTPSDKSGGLTEEQIENVKEQAEAYNNAQGTSSSGGKTGGSTKVPMPVASTDPKEQISNGKGESGGDRNMGVIDTPKNIDTAYLTPTVYEAALMSQYTYKDIADILADRGTELINGWTIDNVTEGGNSCRIVIFKRTDKYGNIGYVLANRGTSDLKQLLVEDTSQLANKSKDVDYSSEFVNGFVKINPNAVITFAGHSKGGVEAAINAIRTDKSAIIFNPAPLNNFIKKTEVDDYLSNGKGHTFAYISEDEILRKVFGTGTYAYSYAEVFYLPIYTKELIVTTDGETTSVPFWDPIFNHSSESVVASLELMWSLAMSSNPYAHTYSKEYSIGSYMIVKETINITQRTNYDVWDEPLKLLAAQYDEQCYR